METEHKWVEAALRESEERYRRLLESITDYIYTVKVEGGRPVSTTHGPGCLAVTGYTSEYFQIYPHLWYEMIHEDDRDSVLKELERVLSGEAEPIEHRIIHKDGSVRWVRNTIVPHYDKDGRLIAYDGIIVDITERKRDEEALKESFSSIERAKRDWEATFDAITDLEELFIGIIKSLSSAIDAKSPWTAGHSERVTKYALDIAKEMELSREEIRSLELAGLLHDIGKIATCDILLDKPGKLDPDEVEIVRRHPGKGAEILEPIKRFRDIIPAIRHHHEFYDGTGYPDRLKGEHIPLLARILTVADTVDAMSADRPYRPGRPMDVIVAELKRCSGSQFDPKVVEAFIISSISQCKSPFFALAD